MEAQAALIGPQGRVELHTEAAIDLALAPVVLPDHAELDDALGDGADLQGLAILGVLLEQGRVFEGRSELCVVASAVVAGMRWSYFESNTEGRCFGAGDYVFLEKLVVRDDVLGTSTCW